MPAISSQPSQQPTNEFYTPSAVSDYRSDIPPEMETYSYPPLNTVSPALIFSSPIFDSGEDEIEANENALNTDKKRKRKEKENSKGKSKEKTKEKDSDNGNSEKSKGKKDKDKQKNKDKDKTPRKKRIVWTSELHDLFTKAINHLGPSAGIRSSFVWCIATQPLIIAAKAIWEYMQTLTPIELTREMVASHLQKHRKTIKE
jgi:hypothetical protein